MNTPDRLGRALSAGKLDAVKRGNGPTRYVLTWTSADGKRHRQALSTDKRVAQQMRAEIVRQRDLEVAGLAPVTGQSMALTELRDAYLSELRIHVGASHLANLTSRLERVLSSITAGRVRDLRVVELMKLRAQFVTEGMSHRTANTHFDALRAMLNWGISAQLLVQNPLANFKRLADGEAHQVCRRRALTEDECRAFVDAAERDDREQAARLSAELTISRGTQGRAYAALARRTRVPQAPLWRSLLETGARWGELTRTTWTDLDVEECVLTLRAETTKSKKSRRIPLRAELVDTLVLLRAIHESVLHRSPTAGDRVFLSPEGCAWKTYTANPMRTLDRLLALAKIERVDTTGRKIDIHALRGSAASRWARNGVPLAVAQRALGHSDPKLTAKAYVHVEVEDMRDSLAGVPELGEPARPRLLSGQRPRAVTA